MPEKLYFSKKVMQQVIVAIAVITVLAGGMYYFLREEPLSPPSTGQAESEAENASNVFFKGSSIIEEQDGKKLWELNADNIETDGKTKKVRFFNVSGIFYQENKDAGNINVVAETGLLDTATKNIELNNQVKITTEDGAVLTANYAAWNSKKRIFTATGDITLTREDVVITGQTLEASPDLEKAIVRGNARVVKGEVQNDKQ